MNFLRKPLAGTLCLWAAAAVFERPVHAADLVPASLRDLAATSAHAENWPRLRRYAKSQADPEWSGWAYFLAGYQEYVAKHYPEAAEDLAQAALSGFSLADYAVFYQASALSQSSRPQDAAAALENFTTHFPQSYLHFQALALRASALLEAQMGPAAVDALVAEPATRTRPALALLLGQACSQAHQFMQASAAFQNVYYNFPLSAQAKPAADALDALHEQMGFAYQDADVALKMARADALLKAGRYPDAQDEYSNLLKSESSSPMAPYWQLGQARCLVHLRRGAEAFEMLANHFASPVLDAQRLALLVQLHVQQSDVLAITQDLGQLEASYALFPAYADALSAAGSFYYRQFNWPEAARDYRRLRELFPQNEHLRDDGWRLAWCDYLLGDPKTSEAMDWFLTEFPDSPRAPAALYWLARVQEEHGALAEARALDALLTQRFVHSYYAPLAAARMAAMRSRQGSRARPNESSAASLAARLISVLAPPTIPPGLACHDIAPGDPARPALILQALDLKNLEEEFIRAALAGDHPPPTLRLLLAGIYLEQKNSSAALFSALRAAPAYSQMDFSDLPQEVWDFLYPRAYLKLIETQARLNNLDPYLVMGLIRQESAFNAAALSVANARGLMQLLPETAAHSNRPARTRLAERHLNDPAYNVRVGCAYLASLLKDFDGHPEFALAAYNAGDFRVRDWRGKYSFHDAASFLESIPFPDTRAYVEMVLRDAEIYRQLLRGAPHFAECPHAQYAAPPHPTGATRGNSVPAGPRPQPSPGH